MTPRPFSANIINAPADTDHAYLTELANDAAEACNATPVTPWSFTFTHSALRGPMWVGTCEAVSA